MNEWTMSTLDMVKCHFVITISTARKQMTIVPLCQYNTFHHTRISYGIKSVKRHEKYDHFEIEDKKNLQFIGKWRKVSTPS